MDRSFDSYALLSGRILVGGFFIWSGIVNALNFSEVSATFAIVHVPDPALAAYAAIAIEVGAGILLVLGHRTRAAAGVLAAYLTTVTVLIHANFASATQTQLFFENLALVGGLMYMTVYGSRK